MPGAVTLSAAISGTKGVALSWGAAATNGSAITSYTVYRLNGGTYKLIATVTGSTLAYTDTSTKAGTSYSYRVKATNAIGTGAYSNTASASAR